jgi:hypothetical protein
MTVTFTSQTERAMFNTVIRSGSEKQREQSGFKQCATMNKNLKISEVRAFLASASRQFERENIFLHNVRFKRDEKTGEVIDIIMSYEQKDNEKEGYK